MTNFLYSEKLRFKLHDLQVYRGKVRGKTQSPEVFLKTAFCVWLKKAKCCQTWWCTPLTQHWAGGAGRRGRQAGQAGRGGAGGAGRPWWLRLAWAKLSKLQVSQNYTVRFHLKNHFKAKWHLPRILWTGAMAQRVKALGGHEASCPEWVHWDTHGGEKKSTP